MQQSDVGNLNELKIAIIGLGYVGLPLAIEFAKKYPVLGFDVDELRIAELESGNDRKKQVDREELEVVSLQHVDGQEIGLRFSADEELLANYNIFIITVPTPVDKFKKPDLSFLVNASETVAKALKSGDIVIYESTVYPGCTEEDCVPVLIKISGLKYNIDFFAGYSPERINPGDRVNTLVNIKKVTSGSTPAAAVIIDQLYRSIITAGTHAAPSIRVAEAAKAIENAQRDVNISFVNELSLIFDRMGIDTYEVLEAAGTKWNFLPFKPGLVGGHCIGVDSYYLAHKAQTLDYYPKVLLSGRNVNDYMGTFVANKVTKLLSERGKEIARCNVLILGIAFKENCPDIRNTKVLDIYNELSNAGANVEVYDPWADEEEVYDELNIKLIKKIGSGYAAVILAVAHQEFLTLDFKNLIQSGGVIFDTKGCLDKDLIDARL